MGCIGECSGPPPNSILSMPPPPLPGFLLARSAIVALSGNDSQPCFTVYVCEPTVGPREQSGIEFVEFSRNGPIGLEQTWIFVLISSCVGVLLFGVLLALILMKCRESYNYSYQDPSVQKQPSLHNPDLPPSKSQFMGGKMLYQQGSNSQNQQPFGNENRVLWATLTPNGTQHFVSEPYQDSEDFYEIVDHGIKVEKDLEHLKGMPIRSFDNSGFTDFDDYEDPTPLIEAYHQDDMDSGYQEPQEILDTLTRSKSPRLTVSTPTRIEFPNMAPLNMCPHVTLQRNHNKSTLLNRRVTCDDASYGSVNM